MSQRSTRSRIDRSQRATQSQRLNQTQGPSQSQRNEREPADNELVDKCVRYFLLRMSSNVPIKRPQIAGAIFKDKSSRSLDEVIKRADFILEQDYGLKIKVITTDSVKKYFVVNDLKKPELTTIDGNEDLKSVVTFFVLTHVFMSRNCATEGSLWEFLKGVNIFPEQKLSEYGTVNLFITKQLVKEQFIQFEAYGSTNDDGEKKRKISWGTRAETSVSKMKILKFVAEIYGNVNVKSWTSRFEDAEKQIPELNPEGER